MRRHDGKGGKGREFCTLAVYIFWGTQMKLFKLYSQILINNSV